MMRKERHKAINDEGDSDSVSESYSLFEWLMF